MLWKTFKTVFRDVFRRKRTKHRAGGYRIPLVRRRRASKSPVSKRSIRITRLNTRNRYRFPCIERIARLSRIVRSIVILSTPAQRVPPDRHEFDVDLLRFVIRR